MAARLRNPHEPGLEDGQERRSPRSTSSPIPITPAPIPTGARYQLPRFALAAWYSQPCCDQPGHRDPVRDERDIEDEEAACGEPEGALGEAFARQRPADDAGQDVPASRWRSASRRRRSSGACSRGRGRGVRVAGAREPLGRPRQVLDDHVQARGRGRPARDEVLRELAVVPPQLLRVGLGRSGGARPGQERRRRRSRPRRRRT